ncbi:hypothetical protein VNO77_43235 [Canavalia gladiata]|uniref:Transmembrane protein 107 n=1 Tax=Canavalia gladiata TaxID=3824 RepID=A0AAN9PMR0_CANGL
MNIMKHKIYSVIMGMELTAIGIKYDHSETNPFKQSSPITLFFYTVIFCHALASMADMSLSASIIFHVSGILGCEALFWILVTELLWYYIINLFLLLLASFCFFNYLAHIIHLLHLTSSRVANRNTQPHQDQV